MKFFNIHNRDKYIVIAGILVTFVSVVAIIVFNNDIDNETVISDDIGLLVKEEVNSNFEVFDLIKVNIKGAVNNPGVYEVKSDSRVIDIIEVSGGLTAIADTSIINLSKKVNDEDVIIIYTKDEVKKIKAGNVVIQYIENECNCPEYKNSACIDPDTLVNTDSEDDEKRVSNGKISINKATSEQLQTLSGIGEAKAKAIIEYRNTNGPFKAIEEIKNISGIGDAIFNKIKDYITI